MPSVSTFETVIQEQIQSLYLTSPSGELFTNPFFLLATCFAVKPSPVAPEIPIDGGGSAEVWISPDPLRQYSSPYTYCGNKPTGCVDKDGRAGLQDLQNQMMLMLGINNNIVYGDPPRQDPAELAAYHENLFGWMAVATSPVPPVALGFAGASAYIGVGRFANGEKSGYALIADAMFSVMGKWVGAAVKESFKDFGKLGLKLVEGANDAMYEEAANLIEDSEKWVVPMQVPQSNPGKR